MHSSFFCTLLSGMSLGNRCTFWEFFQERFPHAWDAFSIGSQHSSVHSKAVKSISNALWMCLVNGQKDSSGKWWTVPAFMNKIYRTRLSSQALWLIIGTFIAEKLWLKLLISTVWALKFFHHSLVNNSLWVCVGSGHWNLSSSQMFSLMFLKLWYNVRLPYLN